MNRNVPPLFYHEQKPLYWAYCFIPFDFATIVKHIMHFWVRDNFTPFWTNDGFNTGHHKPSRSIGVLLSDVDMLPQLDPILVQGKQASFKHFAFSRMILIVFKFQEDFSELLVRNPFFHFKSKLLYLNCYRTDWSSDIMIIYDSVTI